MAVNKKFYYIKLKNNYFDQDNIKILESQPNGYIYSLILLKLYTKSAAHEGRLMMTSSIPYDPKNIDALAAVIGHDVDHVKQAIVWAVKLDLISIINGAEMWMSDIQLMIGHSSTEALRHKAAREFKRKAERGEIEAKYLGGNGETDKRALELELELEKELEKELEREGDSPADAGTLSEGSESLYGKFENVRLTSVEYRSLCEDYSQEVADAAIRRMSIWMKASPEKAPKGSHFAYLQKWPVEEAAKTVQGQRKRAEYQRELEELEEQTRKARESEQDTDLPQEPEEEIEIPSNLMEIVRQKAGGAKP